MNSIPVKKNLIFDELLFQGKIVHHLPSAFRRPIPNSMIPISRAALKNSEESIKDQQVSHKDREIF